MINKKISHSKRVNNLPGEGPLFYTWLIAHLDINGVFYAEPRQVASLVFPRRTVSVTRVMKWLELMAESKKDDETPLIELFEVDGDKYLWVPGFEDEQIGIYWRSEKPEHPLPPKKLYESYGFTYIEIEHRNHEMKDHIRKQVERQQVSGPGDSDPKLAAMITCYEDNIGALTPMLVDELKVIRDDPQIPEGWFAEAVKEAKLQSKGSLKYINGILKRWARDGKGVNDGAVKQHTAEDDSQWRTDKLEASVRKK